MPGQMYELRLTSNMAHLLQCVLSLQETFTSLPISASALLSLCNIHQIGLPYTDCIELLKPSQTVLRNNRVLLQETFTSPIAMPLIRTATHSKRVVCFAGHVHKPDRDQQAPSHGGPRVRGGVGVQSLRHAGSCTVAAAAALRHHEAGSEGPPWVPAEGHWALLGGGHCSHAHHDVSALNSLSSAPSLSLPIHRTDVSSGESRVYKPLILKPQTVNPRCFLPALPAAFAVMSSRTHFVHILMAGWTHNYSLFLLFSCSSYPFFLSFI